MNILPDNVAPYKRTKLFTKDTVPKGLLRDHATKAGVWGVINIKAGEIDYVIEDGAPIKLNAQNCAVIKPEQRHHIALSNDARFYIEFYS